MASYAAGSGVLTIATSSELAHLRPYEHRRCVGLVRPKRTDSRRVIDALFHYSEFDNSNIHRGVHTLADRATEGFGGTGNVEGDIINPADKEQVTFTK